MEPLPEAQWRAPSKVLPSAAAREQAHSAAGAEDDALGEDTDPAGGHIAQVLALFCSCLLRCPYVEPWLTS